MISTLIGNSDAFPILRNWDFFNHAGVCPLPRAAADALRQYARAQRWLVDTGWYRDIDKPQAVVDQRHLKKSPSSKIPARASPPSARHQLAERRSNRHHRC
jgi:hypothetical protein